MLRRALTLVPKKIQFRSIVPIQNKKKLSTSQEGHSVPVDDYDVAV